MAIIDLQIQSQLQVVLGDLEHYKSINRQLQFEIEKQTILNGLTKKENCHLKGRITQIERLKSDDNFLERNKEISRLKNQNQKLEQANEEIKEILPEMNKSLV